MSRRAGIFGVDDAERELKRDLDLRGLGAIRKNGLVIEYYSSGLVWSDKGLQSLHDKLVDIDITFQKVFQGLAEKAAVVIPVLRMIPGLDDLTPAKLEAMASMPCPVAGPAVLLEVAAGGRNFDDFVAGWCRISAQAFTANAAILGLTTGIIGALAGAVHASAFADFGISEAAAIPLTGLAAALAVATVIAGITARICFGMADGKAPSRAEYGELMKNAARAADKPLPSERTLDVSYAALTKKVETSREVTDRNVATSRITWDARVQQLTLLGQPQALAVKSVTQRFGPRPGAQTPPPPKAPASRASTLSTGAGTDLSRRQPVGDNTLVYAGLGIAAVGAAIILSRRKKK